MPRIPLIEDLTSGALPPALNLLVEFDPLSQWYNALYTIAAEWIKQGGGIAYSAYAQPPESVRAQLRRLGLNVDELEKSDRLRIWDYYSATLGWASKERLHQPSLKVHDLSIAMPTQTTGLKGPPLPTLLRVADNYSVLARFNEEKSWIEFTLSRALPMVYARQNTFIGGLTKGIHSDLVYKQFEGAFDGIIEFKVEEEGKTTSDMIRIRSMRNVHFDREWHRLSVGENFEVTLEEWSSTGGLSCV